MFYRISSARLQQGWDLQAKSISGHDKEADGAADRHPGIKLRRLWCRCDKARRESVLKRVSFQQSSFPAGAALHPASGSLYPDASCAGCSTCEHIHSKYAICVFHRLG